METAEAVNRSEDGRG